MSDIKQIKTALISVFHKDGLDEIISLLAKSGVKFLSTGGTRDFIEKLGYPCDAVEDPSSEDVSRPSIPKCSAVFSRAATMRVTSNRQPNIKFPTSTL